MKKIASVLLLVIPFFCLIILSCSNSSDPETGDNKPTKKEISLRLLTSCKTHPGEISSAEIVAFDPVSKRLFVANSIGNSLDILDFSAPIAIKLIRTVKLDVYGNGINSVAVKNQLVAVAVEHREVDKEGSVVFFDTEGSYLNKVQAGVLPDMLTFTPNGKIIVVANEGQPSDDYNIDPEGSISLIDVSGDIRKLSQKDVVNVDFKLYNDSLKVLKARGIRIYGPGATVAQDLEPEYISVSQDSKKAWITLQENNAVAILDVTAKKILDIKPLGGRDYSAGEGNTSFGNSKASCLIKGIHQPDGISSYTVNGSTYLITANEGDSRNYKGFKENLKLGNNKYTLDRKKFPNSQELKEKKNLGKLKVSKNSGDLDEDGDFDEIHCYGSRSFSIWDSSMKNVYDSGDDFERIACKDRNYCKFNERYSKIQEEEELDNHGPEPESVVAGKVNDKTYAFITLERYGGVMVYNVTDPYKPYFIDYTNSNLTHSENEESRPEGILFIKADQSPTGKHLIVVANEGTSTIDVYEIVQ